jgi:nucleolin
VKNLSWDVDDAAIKVALKECGEITEVFWLTDRETKQFKGCGFITFSNAAGASAALKLDGTELMGRNMGISLATPRPGGDTPKKSGGGMREMSEKPEGCNTMFCGNLSFDIDEDSIKAFFKEAGEVANVRWLTDRDTGDFKGCGFIEFVDSASVDKAILLNGTQCCGRDIRLDFAKGRTNSGGGGGGGRDSKPMSEKPEGCNTMFMGNLSFDIDEEVCKKFFKDCGEVANIRWLTDRDTGDFKGCGFVEFVDPASVDKAALLNGTQLAGRNVRLDFAKGRANSGGGGGGGGQSRPMSEKPDGCQTMFMGNLSFDIDDDKVKAFFKDCGTVTTCRWLTDRESGDFKGCGFIEFAEPDAVDKAALLNGTELMGRTCRLDYAKGRDN